MKIGEGEEWFPVLSRTLLTLLNFDVLNRYMIPQMIV